MKRLNSMLKAEINGLQWLKRRDLFKKYPEETADLHHCSRPWILRAMIAYRLQEKHLGIKLSPGAKKYLEEISGDESRPNAGMVLHSGMRIVRHWHGNDYVILVRDDGLIEYNGVIYNSLTTVARSITHTKCNGRIFFGVESERKDENG